MMNDYEEKMDILMYMSENGYDFEGLTFDDFAEVFTVEALRALCEEVLG